MYGVDPNGNLVCEQGRSIPMEYPQKGGHDVPPGNIIPLDQIISNQLLQVAAQQGQEKHPPLAQAVSTHLQQVMRELYQNWLREQKAHRETLQILQAVVNGEIKPNKVAITDEGWTLRKERPGKKENLNGSEEMRDDVDAVSAAAN